MIREYLGRKAAERIDRTKFGDTKVGKISAAIFDDERFEDIGFEDLAFEKRKQHGRYSRYRPFVWPISVNAVSWLSVFLIPSTVSKLALAFALIVPKGALLLVMPVLGFTVKGVYSLLRIWWPERLYYPDDGPVMQSYGRDTESLLRYKLLLVSCGIGGINAILLAIAYFVMTGEYELYIRSRNL